MLKGIILRHGVYTECDLIKYKDIYVRDGSKPDVYVVEEYESTYKKLSKLITGHSVLDIGANIGMFSYKAINELSCSKAVCYEPDPGALSVLKNNITGKQTLIRDCAITKNKGRSILSVTSTGNSMISSTAFTKKGRTDIQVKGESFLDAIEEHRCSLLKVDCEGAELDWLYGTKIPSLVKVVVAELHRWEPGWEDKCYKVIKSFSGWKEHHKPKSFVWNRCYLICYTRD